MAVEPTLVALQNAGSAPADVLLPDGFDIDLRCLNATFDGTGASGAFVACATILSQGGQIIGRFFPSQTFAIGDTGEVTYAPFLEQATSAAPVGASLTGAHMKRTTTLNLLNVTPTTVTNYDSGAANGDLTVDLVNGEIKIASTGIYLIQATANLDTNAVIMFHITADTQTVEPFNGLALPYLGNGTGDGTDAFPISGIQVVTALGGSPGWFITLEQNSGVTKHALDVWMSVVKLMALP